MTTFVVCSCGDPESFVRGGQTLTFFFSFLVDEGKKDLKAGHYWPCKQKAIRIGFLWLADDGKILGGGPDPLSSPLDPHMLLMSFVNSLDPGSKETTNFFM